MKCNSKPDPWPRWCRAYSTAREFRSSKRREARAALRAIRALMLGCAYTPAHSRICRAEEALAATLKLLSVKEWKK